MSKTTDLAAQVEAANSELIAAVEKCSDADWQKKSDSEGWTVAALAHHVAVSYEPIANMVLAVAGGSDPALPTNDQQNATNASHAAEFASVSKADVVALLRQTGTAAAEAVRGIEDGQLGKVTTAMGGRAMTAEDLINGAVIGHSKQHLGSIQAAIGR